MPMKLQSKEAHHCSLLLLGQHLVQWIRWCSRLRSCQWDTGPLSSGHECQRLQRHRLHIQEYVRYSTACARRIPLLAYHQYAAKAMRGRDQRKYCCPSLCTTAATPHDRPACPQPVGPSYQKEGFCQCVIDRPF